MSEETGSGLGRAGITQILVNKTTFFNIEVHTIYHIYVILGERYYKKDVNYYVLWPRTPFQRSPYIFDSLNAFALRTVQFSAPHGETIRMVKLFAW